MDQPAQPSNQREHYRLRYPAPERPKLQIGNQRFPVTELSEGGMRVLVDQLPAEIAGILMLRDGTHLEVTGKFARRVGDECIVIQLTGVSFGVLMAEQRRLLGRYLRV